MNKLTVHWIARLIIWPIIILYYAADENASDHEKLSGAPWFTVGVGSFIAPVIATLFVIAENHVKGDFQTFVSTAYELRYVYLVCFVLYLILGTLCFFSERISNGFVPWQNNGRW